MNHFQATGVIMAISLPNEADAKKGRAGTLTLRYGGRREGRSKSQRQFVNAVPMRIPAKLVKNFREYTPGKIVEIMGRLEGVIENSINGGQHHSPQLIANTIKEVDLSSLGFTAAPARNTEAKPPVGSAESLGQTEANDDDHAEEPAAAAA